jgi:transketolase
VQVSHRSKAAHLASAPSCVDILTVLYGHVLNLDPAQPDHPDRDRSILSKGHAAAALYATLAWKGLIDPEQLLTFGAQQHSLLEGLPMPKLPGVEAAPDP